MSDVTFAHPYVLVALAAVPLVAVAWLAGARRAVRRTRSLSRGKARPAGRLPAAFLALAAAAAIAGAAQPRWGTEQSAARREGTDLMVVMDVSHSMDARDVAPSRLEAAKAAVVQVMQRLGGDRVGLVVFAGSARLRMPLTTDLGAAEQVVRSLETGPIFVSAGTSSASGLDIALGALDSQAPGGKLIVFISDGEDLGTDPAATAARIREAGAELLVAGVGTAEGAPVPVYDQKAKGFVDKKARDGSVLVTKLNEPFLRAIAGAAGGRYLGADLRSVPGAVAGRVASLERARVEERATTIPVERFQWFAAAALALLLLATAGERMAGLSRRRVLVPAVALVGLLLLPGCATRAYELNEQARQAFQGGDTDRAIELFSEVQAERPGDPAVGLNLASALHRVGRFDDAIQVARRGLLAPGSNDRARAYASIGHHQFAAGRLEAALDAFRQALLLNPGDGDSRHDYEVVLRMLEPPAPVPADGSEPPGGDEPPGGGEPPGGSENPVPGAGNQTQPGQPGGQQPGGLPTPPQGDAGSQQPPGGAPPGIAAIEKRVGEIDREVASILKEAGETPGADQAARILDLLAERGRLTGRRASLGAANDPADY